MLTKKVVTLPPYQSRKHCMLVNNSPPMQWITPVSVCFLAIVSFSPLLWLMNRQIVEGVSEIHRDWECRHQLGCHTTILAHHQIDLYQ